jgi:hypothetical protein
MKPLKSSAPLFILMLTAAIVTGLLASGGASAGRPAQAPAVVETVADVAPVLFYQGRLVDPVTRTPKPDGVYPMIFKVYDSEAGGTALWTETKDVAVGNGLFSTLLGEMTRLNPSIFDGRALWMGVTVDADPEATPRMRIAHAPYALHAQQASAADTLGGLPGSGYALTSHEHSGAAITSGLVADERIAGSLARDGEVMPLVLAGDGSGSGLDADRLDGQDATAFAAASHIHDGRYYTEPEADARFINASGDVMTGTLTVPRIAYSAPRIQYLMIGSEGFVPGSNVPYANTYGNGGAYIVSGSGALVAPVHLPHGAVITEFKVFFYDASSSDMTASLETQGVASSYFVLASVSSTGISGYGNQTDATISNPTVDNKRYSYLIYAFCTAWDGGNLRIKGALVTYTIAEAP